MFAENNFKFDENGRKFFDRVETTVEKGEIAPTMFSKAVCCWCVKMSIYE